MILHYVDKVKESTDKRDLLWLSAKERVLIEKYRNSGDKAKYLTFPAKKSSASK